MSLVRGVGEEAGPLAYRRGSAFDWADNVRNTAALGN